MSIVFIAISILCFYMAWVKAKERQRKHVVGKWVMNNSLSALKDVFLIAVLLIVIILLFLLLIMILLAV